MALQIPTALSKSKGAASETSLLLCLSHLRWNFVFQRPQHLLTRAAKTNKVIYFEEPVFESVSKPFLRLNEPAENIRVLTSVLPEGTSVSEAILIQEFLAAGLPVVSTAIVDVVRTCGAQGLVQIADAEDIGEKIREALGNPKDLMRKTVDAYLATMS